jgi:hypothetical protein
MSWRASMRKWFGCGQQSGDGPPPARARWLPAEATQFGLPWISLLIVAAAGCIGPNRDLVRLADTSKSTDVIGDAGSPRDGSPHRPAEAAAIDYGALPMLPQYECGNQAGSEHFETFDAGAPAWSDAGTGTLAPGLIQEVVRARYDLFRSCYESGLARSPDVGGRVAVRFVIGRDGSVSYAIPICTSMPDPEVVRCVVQHYRALHFPKPAGGIVTVVYPIMFSPGD